VVCSECGTAQTGSRKFCGGCGARLHARCPSCGATSPAADRFCGDCGTALPRLDAAGSAARGEGVPEATERRVVSVLFVDLVGFTAYAESRDAEDVRAMLSRYFEAAAEAVARHGGMVEKFIGDAVMAVWGTPVAHEDDAERAVRSALDIVDRVAALGASIGEPLQARAGVATGEAVASLDAIDQGLVAGDLVNTAARLQSAADPGCVLVGERAYRSSADAIEYAAAGPLKLKGKAAEVAVWRALRVTAEPGGGHRGTAPVTPFVGREEDLRHVTELLHATGRDQRSRLVHVTGVAGVGKSRLVRELLTHVDGLTEPIPWYQGRCPSYGDGISFWAVAEMVRARAGIADTDQEEESRDKLGTCLLELVPEHDERAWLQVRLEHLLGLGPVPSGGRDELFAAWRRFFELVSSRGTTVLVVEDLHNADAGLLDFVESLLEWSRSCPVLVVTLARPELVERRPTWGVGVRRATTVHVAPMGEPDMTAMLTGLVDGLGVDAVQSLVRCAEGVPLYAVETVRMLVDRGVLEHVDERFRTVDGAALALGDLHVPETLHALVAARLDALPEAERRLVQDASVTGHSFTGDAVSAVVGRGREDVEPSLRALVRKEVLDLDADPRSPERGQYRFVQSVVREVAYSTLSKRSRRAKHLACARWFETLGDEDLAGVVASHYLDAYQADPSATDAPDIAERSRVWNRRAAERALALGSPQQAYAYARRALELETDAHARAELHVAAGRARRIYAGEREAWSDLSTAIELYRELGDLAGEARAYAEAARLDAGFEGNATLETRVPELVALIEHDHPREAGLLVASLSDRHNVLGRREEALATSERALLLAQTVYDDELLMRAAAARAWAVSAVGRQFEARLLWDAAAALARRDGSSSVLAPMLMQEATSVAADDPMAAIDIAVESMACAEKAGNRFVVEMNANNLVEAFLDTGQWGRAQELMDSRAGSGGIDPTVDIAARFGAEQLRAHRGDPEGALVALQEIATRWTVVPTQVQVQTWFLRLRGLARFLGGDAPGALEDAREGIRLDPLGANAAGNLWLATQAASALRDAAVLADLHASSRGLRGGWVENVRSCTAANRDALLAGTGPDADAALSALHQALETWLELGLGLDHALEVLAATHVLADVELPADHVARARALLVDLDAVSLLRRYDEAGL
jgi:class 3 adenylate cyclase/tetratricopeptide (TPR) repeat protein